MNRFNSDSIKLPLDALIDELTEKHYFSNSPELALDEILSVSDTLVLSGSETQTQGLIFALKKRALEKNKIYFDLSISSPDEFENSFVDVESEDKTKTLKQISGPLCNVLEAPNGLLILRGIDAPIAEGMLNGIFDRYHFYDTNLKRPIKVHKNLHIVAIHNASQEFKLGSFAASKRDRFRQKLWLPSTLSFPLPPSLAIVRSDEKGSKKIDISRDEIKTFEETKATKEFTIDCQYLDAERLQLFLEGGFQRDDKNQYTFKDGALTAALKQNATLIKFENLDLKNPAVEHYINHLITLRELRQPLIVNKQHFFLPSFQFISMPETELKKLTHGKILAKMTLKQIQRLSSQKDVYWLTSKSCEELFEHSYSKKSDNDEYFWKIGSGFLTFFKNPGSECIGIVIKPLPLSGWYKLIIEPGIKTLYVLNTIKIPTLFQSLFKNHEEVSLSGLSEYRPTIARIEEFIDPLDNSLDLGGFRSSYKPKWLYLGVCSQNQAQSFIQSVHEKRCDLFLMSNSSGVDAKKSDPNHLYLYKEDKEEGEEKLYYKIEGEDEKQYLTLAEEEDTAALKNTAFDQGITTLNKYNNKGICKAVLAETSKKRHTREGLDSDAISVIHTSKDHDSQLLVKYNSKHRPKIGPLLEDLRNGKTVILTGSFLLNQLPNFFKQRALFQFNEEIKQETFHGNLIILIDQSTLEEYPSLSSLPQIHISPYLEQTPLHRCDETGYPGFLKALEEPRLIFATGPKASGKTYSLTQLKEEKKADIFSYTLSGNTTFADLEPIIKKWIGKPAKGDDEKRWQILALDELTLADPEVLSFFQGYPNLCFPNGTRISLNPKIYKIACLMNPAETTRNRNPHTELAQVAIHVTYLPMKESDLLEKVIKPALKEEMKPNDVEMKRYTSYLMELRKKVALLQPEIQLNPRDFLALIARIASSTYPLTELKLSDSKLLAPKTISFEQALLIAIEQVILPQLKPAQAEALKMYYQQVFGTVESPTTLDQDVTSHLVATALPKQLWDTPSTRHTLATLLGFMRTFFYYQQKQKIMPGKAGLLILGPTSTGKSYLTNYLLEQLGYKLAQDCIVMTLSVTTDLTAVMEQIKVRKSQTSSSVFPPPVFNEADLAAPNVLEGILNSALTGDSDPLSVILTANWDYPFRQMLSEPFLSRLIIYRVEDFSPEELLNIYGISKKRNSYGFSDFELLLKIHTVPLASTRTLISTLEDYKLALASKLESESDISLLRCACQRNYSVILAEAKQLQNQSEIKTIDTAAYHHYLKLLQEEAIVVRGGGTTELGELLLGECQILLPSPELSAFTYGILLWRTIQFGVIRLLTKQSKSKKIPEEIYSLCYGSAAEELALDAIQKYYPGTLLPPSLRDKTRPEFDQKLPEEKNPSALPKITETNPKITGTNPRITETNPRIIETKMMLSPSPDSSSQSYSQKIPLAGMERGSQYRDLAYFEAQKATLSSVFIPQFLYSTTPQGLLILDGGDFRGESVPQSAFPKQESKECRVSDLKVKVTLQDPKIVDNRIALLVPVGYYPHFENDEKNENKLVWKDGYFYVNKGNSQGLSKFEYYISPGDPQDAHAHTQTRHRPKNKTPLISIDTLDVYLRPVLYALQHAKDFAEQRNCLDKLCELLKTNLIYLDNNADSDKESNQARRELSMVINQQDVIKLVLYCLSNKKVADRDAAVIFYTLCITFLPPTIPVYLMGGFVSYHTEKVTTKKHAQVLIQWPDNPYLQRYDVTPGETKTSQEQKLNAQTTENGFVMNPLLRSLEERLTENAKEIFRKLSQSALTHPRSLYRKDPPGAYQPHREFKSHKIFKVTLTRDTWEPQTLLFIAPPYHFNPGVTSFAQWNCIHFLIYLLLKKKFKILVWGKPSPIPITTEDEFINAIQQMRVPSAEELKEFSSPHAYLQVGTREWETLILRPWAEILKTITLEDKNRYVRQETAGTEIKLKDQFFLNFRRPNTNLEIVTEYLASKLSTDKYICFSSDFGNILNIHDTTIDQQFLDGLFALEFDFKLVVFNIITFNEVIDFRVNAPNIQISSSRITENFYKSCVKYFNMIVHFQSCEFDFIEFKSEFSSSGITVEKKEDRTFVSMKTQITVDDDTVVTQDLLRTLSLALHITFPNCIFEQELDLTILKYVLWLEIKNFRGTLPNWNLPSSIKFLRLNFPTPLLKPEDVHRLVNNKLFSFGIMPCQIPNSLHVSSNSGLERFDIIGEPAPVDTYREIISDKFLRVNVYTEADSKSTWIFFASSFQQFIEQPSLVDDDARFIWLREHTEKNCVIIIIDVLDFKPAIEFFKNYCLIPATHLIAPPAAAIDAFIKKFSPTSDNKETPIALKKEAITTDKEEEEIKTTFGL